MFVYVYVHIISEYLGIFPECCCCCFVRCDVPTSGFDRCCRRRVVGQKWDLTLPASPGDTLLVRVLPSEVVVCHVVVVCCAEVFNPRTTARLHYRILSSVTLAWPSVTYRPDETSGQRRGTSLPWPAVEEHSQGGRTVHESLKRTEGCMLLKCRNRLPLKDKTTATLNGEYLEYFDTQKSYVN